MASGKVICFLLTILSHHASSQQHCRYVTVPMCDGEATTSPQPSASKGDRGNPGKAGAPGDKGVKGEVGKKGEVGPVTNIEHLEQLLNRKFEQIETKLNQLLLPPNCAASTVTGYQKLRSGEYAYCDGGWTVFQLRFRGDVDFNLPWNAYKNGFGNMSSGDFWLGLDKVHQAVKNRGCRLRFDLWSFDGDHAYAEYSDFYIEDESDFYRLHVGGYSGTAGDCLLAASGYHNNKAFTTLDRDNDPYGKGNCAVNVYGTSGGWWFNTCQYCKLNAAWGPSQGIYHNNYWHQWKGDNEALNGSVMKFHCN